MSNRSWQTFWSYRHELILINALATVLYTHPLTSLSSLQGSGELIPPGHSLGDDMQWWLTGLSQTVSKATPPPHW